MAEASRFGLDERLMTRGSVFGPSGPGREPFRRPEPSSCPFASRDGRMARRLPGMRSGQARLAPFPVGAVAQLGER